MVRAVKQLESGMSAEAINRDLGLSRVTLYKWKSKYSCMVYPKEGLLPSAEETTITTAGLTKLWVI